MSASACAMCDPDPQWPVWRSLHDAKPLAPEERIARIAAVRRAIAAGA